MNKIINGGLIDEKDILQLNEVTLLSFLNQNNFVDNLIPFKEVKDVLSNLGKQVEAKFSDEEAVKLDSDLLDANLLIKGSCNRIISVKLQKDLLSKFIHEACRLTKTNFLVAYTGDIYSYSK